jgi:hypothetical protein
MSDHSLQLVEAIRARLALARRRVVLAEVAFGLLLAVAVLSAALVLGSALEAGLWLASGVRWAFVIGFVTAALALLAVFVVRPVLRGLGVLGGLEDAAVARRVGSRYPEVGDRLANLLDLADGRCATAPAPLVDGAVQMLGRQISPVPFERIEDVRPIRQLSPVAAVPTVGLLVALLAAPAGFGDAMQRLFTPGSDFAQPALFSLAMEPGDVEIAPGAELRISVRASGESLPRTVALELRREGEERIETLRLVMGPDGTFAHVEENVRQGLRYRAVAEDARTSWYRASVVARPVVAGLRLTLRPPAYTGLPALQLPPDVGDVAALPGTTVELTIDIGGSPADSAAAVFDSGLRTPLAVAGRQASGRFPVRAADAYRVEVRGREGHTNADPIVYTVRTLTDAPPQIRLLEPTDGSLSQSLTTRVAARVTDDYGFSRAVLAYRLAERSGQPVESDFREVDISIQTDVLDQDISRPWLLGASGLDLRPGDAVAFYLEVWDNNTAAGYQSARTPVHVLRFPSVREQFDQLDEAEDAARRSLDGLREESDDARRRFDELRNELLRKQDAGWEERRQLERLTEQQRGLDQQVQESVRQMQEVIDQMRQNDLMSEETTRLYEELQRVIDEIADPELLEQLRRLQEAMEEMNFEQMMQSMERFEFDERSFRERIERALDLFERLSTAKELEEAASRAEDIARQEEALSEQTESLRNESLEGGLSPEEQQAEQDRLAEQQQQAQEAAEALKQQLEQLQQKAEEMRNSPAGLSQELGEMQQQLEDALQQMQQNQDQLQGGELQDAQQGQQSLQQMMQQMQQQLMMMGEQMSGAQQQRNLSGLRRVLDDVLTLSFEQENLRDRSGRQRGDSPAVRQNAQQQVELASGLSTVTDSLRALAREIPEMERTVQQRAGDAIREMGQATEQLAERQPPRAAGHQKAAMTALNELGVLLADLLDQMSSGGQGGGQGMPMQQMMQQLQQMGGDQQQLNQQIQQMLNDMQGQRLSVDQESRLQQLRDQQQLLQEQLESLIREGGMDGQTRSDLQRIAEEMEQVARKMQGGRLDRDIREQQDRILTRLLEAADSINERGRREEREGTPADQERRDPPVPGELPPREEIDRLRRDLIRALESGYSPDYQELIKRYFELLQQRTGD